MGSGSSIRPARTSGRNPFARQNNQPGQAASRELDTVGIDAETSSEVGSRDGNGQIPLRGLDRTARVRETEGSMTGARSDDNDRDYEGGQVREQVHAGEAFDVLSRHGSGSTDASERRIAGLVRTIEGEIIPRLMLAHAARGQELVSASGASTRQIESEQVDALVHAVMTQDTEAALLLVRALIHGGVSLESIYLDLLSTAARRTGEMWEADVCSFTDVTIGLWRLQEVMHEVGMANAIPPRTAEPPHRVLLRQTPGEQHSFGLNMVAEFFRRAGWQVHDDSSEAGTDPVDNVRGRWFDVVGLSLSGERHLDVLATTIHAIRKASRNRGVGVMVGGPLFIEHPDLVARVGADTTANDGRQAVLQAHSMIGLLARCG
ncbi:MAG: cobalamin B12-binding domain-containing protein [Rhodocyclaceae bacterium]|nr:cobalamin B12-binding domain-containing protein [Rhodocyclaceae bacterium]MCA3073299.1 cobalamin B12-binding domain-containing protein [Rhodocyclaceae bacterium]MCA3091339.1 cobalamin B12-binding domain-containing protein [Rhodocyclaceae bacterium]MCA3094148.1 cobalamin B12-binding domain-containing protein [Rhodocyclaceae bacterium]MCA3098322.1 cobalamin B12-binding domain-containing protein [Rhodocyclaceae bacterium]